MREEILARKVYEEDVKRERERPRKMWMEEMRKTYEARGEKWENAGKICKTDKSGNNYGRQTHETQLCTTLQLTVTWVLKLSK